MTKIGQSAEDLRHHALLAWLKTAGAIEKAGTRHFAAYGLTPAQYDVLIVLKLNGGQMTQVAMSRLLTASRANVTGLVDKLQDKGYVERRSVEGDRRLYAVTLTARGKAKVDEVEPIYLAAVKRIMAPFAPADCERMIGFAGRLSERLEDEGGSYV